MCNRNSFVDADHGQEQGRCWEESHHDHLRYHALLEESPFSSYDRRGRGVGWDNQGNRMLPTSLDLLFFDHILPGSASTSMWEERCSLVLNIIDSALTLVKTKEDDNTPSTIMATEEGEEEENDGYDHHTKNPPPLVVMCHENSVRHDDGAFHDETASNKDHDDSSGSIHADPASKKGPASSSIH